jgi:hypothetical protein
MDIYVKYFRIAFAIAFQLIATFTVAFVSTVASIIVTSVITRRTFNLPYPGIIKESAVYGLCVIFAVVTVYPSIFIIKRYIWPALKFVGLRIRYFFHGY